MLKNENSISLKIVEIYYFLEYIFKNSLGEKFGVATFKLFDHSVIFENEACKIKTLDVAVGKCKICQKCK